MLLDDHRKNRTEVIDLFLEGHCQVMRAAFRSASALCIDDPLRAKIEASRMAAEAHAIALLNALDEDHHLTHAQFSDLIEAGSPRLLAAFPTPPRRRTVSLDFNLTPLLAEFGPAYAERLIEISYIEGRILTAILPLAQDRAEWRPLLARLCKLPASLSDIWSYWRAWHLLSDLPGRIEAWPAVLPRAMTLLNSACPSSLTPLYETMLNMDRDPERLIRVMQILRACGAHVDTSTTTFHEITELMGSNHQRIALNATCEATRALAARPLGGPDDPI